MNATVTELKCTNCGHKWEPQKLPEEYAQGPRCSECQASGDTIEHIRDNNQKPSEREQVPLVEKNRHVEKAEQLTIRIDCLLETASGLNLPGSEDDVVRELQPTVNALKHLKGNLNDPSNVDQNLENVERRIEELESEVEDHADDIKSINQIPELQSRVEKLIEEIEAYKDRKEDLSEEIQEKQESLNHIENLQDAWDSGYEAGRNEYAITITCLKCGEEMAIKPNSMAHLRMRTLFKQDNFRAHNCNN